MKKIKFNSKFWINAGIFSIISAFFIGTLTAAVLADHNINGQREFSTISQTVLADPQQGEFVFKPGSEPKNGFTTYVHSQNQPTFDGAFNEQMLAGVADFIGITNPDEWRNIKVYISPNSQANSFQGQYVAMKEAGYKVATVGGFDHIPAIMNSLNDPRFQEFGWILMDESLPYSRVASGLFQGEQSGFLAGVATALYLNVYYDDYKSGGLKATTYGGRPFDPVVAFMGGYRQGIEYWNDSLRDLMPENQNHEVEFLDLGDFDSFFVGGFESDRAIAITERMLNLGADAIFPVAGVQTREVVSVINQRDEPAVVIGVDTPMEDNSTFQKINNVTGRPTIPFSAVKDFRDMTNRIVDNIYNRISGINPENGVAGLGWINVGNIDNGLVSVSKQGYELFEKYLTIEQIDLVYQAADKTKNYFDY